MNYKTKNNSDASLASAEIAIRSRQEKLDYQSGIERKLPNNVQRKIENHFGYNIDNLQFRESSDVGHLGAKAYTAGNTIHFQPGEYKPHSSEGQKMIGHEVAHVLQQAKGEVDTVGGISLDQGMESSADYHGSAIAGKGTVRGSVSTSPSKSIPTANTATAPVQGWGIGGFLPMVFSYFGGKKKKEGYANIYEGGHEMLTRKAGEKATGALAREQQGNFGSEGAIKSRKAGARFNDIYHSNPLAFALKYATHSDEYINQSHHGDMQFLHSMDTSGGNLEKNAKKIQRWAKFAADTYQNAEGNFQNQNMLDYLTGLGEDDLMGEMMLSTMVDKKKLKEIEGAAKDKVMDDNVQQYQAIRLNMIRDHVKSMQQIKAKGKDASKEEKKQLKKGLSGYADKSIGEFFTGGNKKLDAGQVALGSASHMLEDSFAGSHAIRGYNAIYQNQLGGLEVGAGQADAIAGKTTPIMINADYTVQDEKKHGAADFLLHTEGEAPAGFDQRDMEISNTYGAGLARDVAAQYMYMVASGQGDVGEFLRKVTTVDASAGKGMTTASGRQYAKTVPVPGAEQEIGEYESDLATSIAQNKTQTISARNQINERHLYKLAAILNRARNTQAAGKEDMIASYKQHVSEIKIETGSMLKQTTNQAERDALQTTANLADHLLGQ